MTSTGTNKKYCVWMEAGVIDFKICNKDLDCEHCDFDRAMTETAAQNLALRRSQEPTKDRKDESVWAREKKQPPFGQHPKGQPGTGELILSRLREAAQPGARSFEQLLKAQKEFSVEPGKPEMHEVFGVAVPTYTFLHRGHTWASLENNGLVRIGLDDFSQKVLGPLHRIDLPEPGLGFRKDTRFLSLARQGHTAPVLAPVDGIIEAVNKSLRHQPGLVHDDPFGDGWLCIVNPINLKEDLENLLYGQSNIAWIEHEAMKLMGMLESSTGMTLPSGGTIIDDVFGHYPQLGWERLVQEFLHTA